MGLLAATWTKFSALRHKEGDLIAFRLLVRRSGRAALTTCARIVLTALPFPLLFMRRGVLFIGYLEAMLGLGESLRSLVRAVAETDLPFALYPYQRGVETRLTEPFMADRYDQKHSYAVNVIEMATDQLPGMFASVGLRKTHYSYNILRTYWELATAPTEWTLLLRGIHEIWVPNTFVGNAFRAIFDGPIFVVPPCVEVGGPSDLDRERFGMSADRFYFIFSFDYFSVPARKNPLAVVRAFQAAFPGRDDEVGLIIKSTSATDHYPDIKSALLQAASHDDRITVIDSRFSRHEMLSLIRQSDCYVSLHRSEGFGLGMAEAMALGKPVIGTDYSGSVDFLSEATGFPVPFTLRPLQPGEYFCWEGQSWAEPDEATAAKAMRRVFDDRNERQRRAAAGKALVKMRYGRKNVARIASLRLRAILAEKQRNAERAQKSAAARSSPHSEV